MTPSHTKIGNSFMRLDVFALLDRFLPAGLQQSNDNTRLLKGRVLVFLSLMYLLSLGPMIVIFTVLGLLGIFSLWSAVLSSSISCCLYACQLMYFKRGGDMFRAANIGMFTMVAATTTCVAVTSGWTSPIMMILLCTPTCAFLMDGKRAGTLWSAAVATIGAFFLVAYINGIHFPQLITENLQDYLAYFSWLYGFMIVASGIVFYGNLTEKLNASARRERELLVMKASRATEMPQKQQEPILPDITKIGAVTVTRIRYAELMKKNPSAGHTV